MQAMQFNHRNRRVKLRAAERAAKSHAVGTNARGFFGGKFFDAKFLARWRIRQAQSNGTRRGFAKFVELMDVFPRELESFFQRFFCARWRS